jgi:hypothetical protein
MTWARYVPLHGFLIYLATGWQLPWIVEPMAGPHGAYSVLVTRDDAP